jgi:hypothetical protein
MNESLKSVLTEQAASVVFKPPDLEAIASDSTRHVRHRRAAAVLTVVGAVAVVASAAAFLLRPIGPEPQPADTGWGAEVSWAVGSTIHVGDQTIDAGHDVRAYVRTSVGFVTLDDAGTVYSITDQGVAQIGQAAPVPRDGREHLRLVSDPRGTLAGWIAAEQSGVVLQVHDQATGQSRSYDTNGAAQDGVVFFAIDGRTAYWRMGTRTTVVAVDLDTGDEQELASGAEARDFHIFSAENGVLAFSDNYRLPNNVTSVSIGRSVDDARELTFSGNTEASGARLSPTGAWLSYLLIEFDGPPQRDEVLAFTPQVRNISTDDLVSLDLPPAFALPVVWLDDSTLQVFVLEVAPDQQDAEAHMYACRVPDGSCHVAADLPLADVQGSNLVSPVGTWIGE